MTKRLTDAQILSTLYDSGDPEGLLAFARAIESAVLERSEQEPVAWICGDNDSYSRDHKRVEKWRIHGREVIPLYTAPQAVKAEPVAFI
jgi:hypothetical protein